MALIEFLHSKARALVVFLFSEIALGLFFLSTIVSCAVFDWPYYGLIFGIILMVAAIPFHWNGKKWKMGYVVSFLLNSVGSGLSVSTLYLDKDVSVIPFELLVAALPAAGVLLLVYLMLQIFHKTKSVTVTVACFLNAALTVGLLVMWIMHGYQYYSFAFFSSLISFFYLCVYGITVGHEERSLLRDISFGGFGSFIILTVVVVFILSEGELLEGLDMSSGSGGKKRKKK